MTTRPGSPVFDSDNHLYETREAFTRHLPDRYRGAIDYVEVRGRTKIVVRGTISEYIPNPTFEVVARPGAQEEYFRVGNPEGKSYREIVGEPMRGIPRAWPIPAATSTTCRTGMSDDAVAAVMGGNLSRLMGVDVPTAA